MIWTTVALAGFEPVTTSVGRSAVVNWTDVRLEVTAMEVPGSAQGIRATEEIARRRVDGEIDDALLQVQVDPGRTIEDLRSNAELWHQIEPRFRRWVEAENRYYTSGRVAVVGAVDLVGLLKPLTMSTATERSRPSSTEVSGLVIDARGLPDVTPCFAPVIKGPNGEIHDGQVWLHAAAEKAAAVWVKDAAHPAAARAGTAPLLVRAAAATGCELSVDAGSAEKIVRLEDTGVLGEGTIVVVVD